MSKSFTHETKRWDKVLALSSCIRTYLGLTLNDPAPYKTTKAFFVTIMFRITREHREQLAKSAHAFGTTAKNNLKHILAKHEKKLKGQKDLSKDKQRHVHDAVSY